MTAIPEGLPSIRQAISRPMKEFRPDAFSSCSKCILANCKYKASVAKRNGQGDSSIDRIRFSCDSHFIFSTFFVVPKMSPVAENALNLGVSRLRTTGYAEALCHWMIPQIRFCANSNYPAPHRG